MTVIAIGIGCTSRATADDILAVIEDAMKKGGLTPNVLATIDRPALNHILRIAAEKADLELRLMDVEELRQVAMGCKTHSEKSMTQYGVPSVAEAAALAAAGPHTKIALPRICGRNTTASIATAE